MRLHDVTSNPNTHSTISDFDTAPPNESSTSHSPSPAVLREVEMTTMRTSTSTDSEMYPLRRGPDSESVLHTRFDGNKVWEGSTSIIERQFQLNDAKQALEMTVGNLELDIINSNTTAEDKAGKLEHLKVLERRSLEQLPMLAMNLKALYGHRNDFNDVLKDILKTFIVAGLERPEELKALDLQRENNPNWLGSNKSIEATLYVDRHCGTLDNLEKEINLFKSLNINILHLMPTIYKLPSGDNDGGYAISDFRTVNPEIGTMDQLRDVFSSMRKQGISPAMDVTINHTAHDHPWAEAAKAGDSDKQGFYFLMDEAEKDEYQPHLPDVFPDIRKGSFTWNSDTNKFVWTTFKSSQWDLNYKNPKVLAAMGDELMFLANQGTEVFRLDAVPCIWKMKGTDCFHQENVPSILRVYNAMAKIAAPGVVFKSESINEPKLAKPYVGPDLCQLGYNAMMPTQLWDALANEDATLLSASLARHMQIPDGRAWVNYTRCHDELAFHFDTDILKERGIDLNQRLTGLRQFYLGNTEGSFSTGQKFQAGLIQVSGTQASLAGVEQALQSKDPQQIEAAVNRVKLLNSVVLSVPGIPLINFTGGDDRGQINDYSFLLDEAKKDDNRWLHRPLHDVDLSQKDPFEVQVMGRVFTDLADLNRIRALEMSSFGVGPMQVIQTGNEPVLGFIRENDQQKVMVLANFSGQSQQLDSKYLKDHGMTVVTDKVGPANDQPLNLENGIELAPYQSAWLVPPQSMA